MSTDVAPQRMLHQFFYALVECHSGWGPAAMLIDK